MGKSYNNQIKLTEMFNGDHPLLTKAFSPMTIRFFILQTHYRSTLDFSSEALEAAEKGLKRLWEAYEALQKLQVTGYQLPATGNEYDSQIIGLLNEFDEFMNDDFNTAKVLANMFEIVPVINSIKDGLISVNSLSSSTIELLQAKFKIYLEDIFGLKSSRENDEILDSVMQLLIEIRKEARTKKDFATSDKIRKELNAAGILLKDKKDGQIEWELI
jgi:cysteinyl-tRNA synthetase